MNIPELQQKLRNLNIDMSASEICRIWGMDKGAFSRKKTAGTEIKFKHLKLLEENLNIKLIKVDNSEIDEPYIIGTYYPDVFGSCGNGAFVLSESTETIKIPEKCFIKPISKIKKYSVINAYGSSMSPTLNDKDKLIVEHIMDGERIQDDKIYVFAYDEQIMVKRLYYNVDEIIIKSDNPDPIFKVKYIQKENMNKFILIGQVVGLMRDMR